MRGTRKGIEKKAVEGEDAGPAAGCEFSYVLGRLRLGSRRMPQPAAEYSSAISVFFVPRKGARDRKLAYVSKSYDAALVHLHIRLLLQVVHVLHFAFPRNGHRIVVGPSDPIA